MKNNILCFAIFSVLAFSVHAQHKPALLTNITKEDGVSMIREALKGSMFVIRQEYILKSIHESNTKKYGTDSTEYYGKKYGFGILCTKRLLTNMELKTPWTTDTNYLKTHIPDTLKPALSLLYIKSPEDAYYTNTKYTIKDSISAKDSLKNRKMLFNYELIVDTTSKTVRADRNSKDSTGWIVVAHAGRDFFRNDSLPVNISIFKTTLHFNDSTNEAAIKNIAVEGTILGGAFFRTVVSPGKIDFLFSGILFSKNNVWYIQRPLRAQKNLQKTKDTEIPKDNK